MKKMWRFTLSLLLVSVLDVSMEQDKNSEVDFEDIIERFRIVPNAIPHCPHSIAQVQFNKHTILVSGELSTNLVTLTPKVTWDGADPKSFYTVCMLDVDYPNSTTLSYNVPKNESFIHWLVGNIPGQEVDAGEKIVEYLSAMPKKHSGYHRYLFLVYKQPSKLTFDEPRLTLKSLQLRKDFSITSFTKKYNLGNPVAFNFFLAVYDKHAKQMEKERNNKKGEHK